MSKAMRSHGMRTWLGLALALAVIAPMGWSSVQGQEDDEHELPIMDTMNEINEHYKMLRREARRLRFNDETIERAVDMQSLALQAMHQEFAQAQEVSDPEARKEMVIGFKKMMAQLVNKAMELEIALLEDRKEDAKDIIGELTQLKSDGHEEYAPDAL